MPVYYSLVARGSVPLCSHQEGAGRFHQVATSMLSNIPTRNNARTTYTTDNEFLFHVMVENGLIYLCATDPACSKLTAYGFLNEIKSAFVTGSLAQRAQFADEHEFDGEFKRVLQMQMESYSRTSTAGGTQLSRLQAQVNEVKDVMTQNIERVLERGERLDDLMEKTEDLEASAQSFKSTSSKVHRKMWWNNMKMKMILTAVILVILLIIILVILFETNVLPVKHNTTPAPTTPTVTTTKI